jgi:alkanesulfonate monooxygenase SsuD/methylene tetrahydromethanopterin reductase-like flavin-dependent oxidoreductase (luciferase family)
VPPGRLVRLGVVLDPRDDPDRRGQVATMCDRAGIDVVWLADASIQTTSDVPSSIEEALALAGAATSRLRLGAMLETGARPPEAVAAMVWSAGVSLTTRLELGLRAPRHPQRATGESEPTGTTARVHRVRDGFGTSNAVSDYAERLRWQLSRWSAPQVLRIPLALEAAELEEIDAAVRVAETVIVPFATLHDVVAFVGEVRRRCAAAGREPSTLGVAVELAVCIGRTVTEAQARAGMDPSFLEMVECGGTSILGTLEQGQDAVIELAYAGVTDLLCVPPRTADVHDLIAQLTAMVVGTPGALRPGAPRSKPPDPPRWIPP